MAQQYKIAIPTNEGVFIRQRFMGSRAFLVTTVEEGKIIDQELRWNLLSEKLISKYGTYYNLFDCALVIVNDIDQCHERMLKDKKIKILNTKEPLITKVFKDYLTNIPEYSEIK
ncbi:MAG: hypothetical protein ABSD71_00590 [Bacteroidales bacterium]|jgi:predicted Fe-Mo cluster-binding NifX family protein